MKLPEDIRDNNRKCIIMKFHITVNQFSVVNWKYNPAYKLAMYKTQTLEMHYNYQSDFSIKNSVNLIHILQDIHINNNIRLFLSHHKHIQKHPEKGSYWYNPKHPRQQQHTRNTKTRTTGIN
jgi:hypothetical protein